MATLKGELAIARASRSQLVEVATRAKPELNKVQTDLQKSQERLVEGGQEAKLDREDLNRICEQSVGSDNAAEKALHLLKEMTI